MIGETRTGVPGITAVLAAYIFFLAAPAFGGTVRTVNKGKRTVVVDLAEDETWEAGTKVCIYSAAGKKIDCGSVTKIKNTTAQIKLSSAKKLKKIKKGMSATAGDDTAGDSDAGNTTAASPEASKRPFQIWGLYIPALVSPTKYNKIGYDAPAADVTTPETLWLVDKTVSKTTFGFGLGVGIPIGAMALKPGFRYRSFNPSVVDADLKEKQENPYVRTEQTATAIGFWLDFQFLTFQAAGLMEFFLAGGLDFDSSTVTMTTYKKDDTGTTPEADVASATSKATVISLRLGFGLDFRFTSIIGASLHLNGLVPLAVVGKSFSANFEEGEDLGMEDPEEDLDKKMGHGKSGFGFDLAFGPMLTF